MDSGLGRESRVYNLAGPGTLFQDTDGYSWRFIYPRE